MMAAVVAGFFPPLPASHLISHLKSFKTGALAPPAGAVSLIPSAGICREPLAAFSCENSFEFQHSGPSNMQISQPWRHFSLLPCIVVAGLLLPHHGLLHCVSAAGTPDLAVASSDPDFAIQGEYVGTDRAMHVIAAGDGDFDLVIYEGGLPGAGAKGEPRRLQSDIDSIGELIESMGMKRVQRDSPTLGLAPPGGAIVLFDGTPASAQQHWSNAKITDDGLLEAGTTTKQNFKDYTLHLEFRTPYAPKARGQGRGNSGVYHQGRYETQILDSFGLKGLNDEAGGIYTVSAPTVNACLPPLQWQTYDVEFTSARFDDNGTKTANAKLTVRLNGIMVQNDVEVPGPTRAASHQENPQPGPLMLQNHGDPVRFRNIWLMPRDAEREAARPIVPGFERFVGTASTSLADAGDVLISSLACAACHAEASSVLPVQHGPDLNELVARVRPDAVVAMIADPKAEKCGTTMPDPWPTADEATRQNNAQKIASYLLLQGKGKLVDRVVSQSLADRGGELYHRIGCVACHGSLDEAGKKTPMATTVPLGNTHRKYTVPSLIHFLQNCTTVRGGLRMPAMVGTSEELAAVAAYLTQQTTVGENEFAFTRRIYRGKWDKLPDFSKLKPEVTDEVTELKIDDIQPKNFFGVVYEAKLSIENDGKYTFALSSDDGSALEIDGHRLVNDGIHPTSTKQETYDLKAGVYPIRVEYFDGGGQIELKLEMIDPRLGRDNVSAWITSGDSGEPINLLPSEFVPDGSLVEQGKELFASAKCVNCHSFAPSESANVTMAAALDRLPMTGGCLSAEVKSPAVDFGLGATQIAAITAALERRRSGESPIDSDKRLVHATMMALNCYACHERDAIGGPEPSRDDFFQTTTPEMGLEGRLPPSLTGVADKLNDAYLSEVLKAGANARNYMHTRMPAFDHDKLAGFQKAIVNLDRNDEMQTVSHDVPLTDVPFEGRKLCGNTGLSCIKCHSYNGNTGGGLGAIDMLMMTQRLRPEWFQRYLKDPIKYRPGTRMPNSFVDGRSAITNVFDGDPDKQIDAMWQYLVLGTKAKEPQGLNQAAIVLTADERPRIYRNFFEGVSSRGIGVGYPQEINLIWDADQMSLARVWKNSFMDASMHWRGRGQGRQQPLGDAIIPVDTATPLAVLNSITDAWPTKSGRDLGYRMRGYSLDDQGNPAFQYSIGETTIEDQPLPTSGGFQRQLTIQQPASGGKDMIWQIATGQIEAVEEGYRIDERMIVHVKGVDVQMLNVDGKQMLRATIPATGTTTVSQIIRW
jgi:mono/diheme cytochrome c family protein